MRLTLLGTCSGTEPMPGRKHVSFVVEHDGGVTWFDAGEGCSRTAHLLGIDLASVRAIFISHTHMDHIGGLANLLWTMRKLTTVDAALADRLRGRTIRVWIPDLDVWRHILGVLGGTEGGFRIDYQIEGERVRDGLLYDADGLRVEALHNRHLGEPADGESWLSYSFRIEADDKRVVFSGDVKDVRELTPLLDDCDLLLMETGHHDAEAVCRTLVAMDKVPVRLGFIHHGRAILDDPEGECAKARAVLGDRVFIADDGMRLTL